MLHEDLLGLATATLAPFTAQLQHAAPSADSCGHAQMDSLCLCRYCSAAGNSEGIYVWSGVLTWECYVWHARRR